MHTESHWLKKALPTRLTDFGASHCLGLPAWSAPQGATACSSALRKTQLIPGRTTIPSMLLDTCRSQLKADFSLFSPHSVFSVIARFPVSFEVQKKKVTGGLWAHTCRSARGPFRLSPFPTHSTCECICSCSKLFLAPSSPVQSWSRSYKLFGEFALHELGASWLGKREVGRSEWVPHPTQNTHSPGSFKRRAHRFIERWQVSASEAALATQTPKSVQIGIKLLISCLLS